MSDITLLLESVGRGEQAASAELLPLDDKLRERLLPLGARTEFLFSGLNPRLASGWAVIPVSLWRYRLGD